MTSQGVIAFWRPTDINGIFSQWWKSDFTLTSEILTQVPNHLTHELISELGDILHHLFNYTYSSAEKFMMMCKALLFGDMFSFSLMKVINDPKLMKTMGRTVVGFIESRWKKYSILFVTLGNFLKFTQVPGLKKLLQLTGNNILVEGSPMDKIWGVGLKFDNPLIQHRKNWRGQNLLGIALMDVRAALQIDESIM